MIRKRIYYYIDTAVLVVCMLLSVTSCIKEDLSVCPPLTNPLRLVLAFEKESDDVSSSYAVVDQRATLHIFDADGKSIAMQTLDDPDFGQEYAIDTDLPSGIYNFVVWYNHEQPYFSTSAFENYPAQKPNKNEGKLYLQLPASGIVDFALPRLLYGKLENKTITPDERVITIPMIQNTNNIILTVTGLERTGHRYLFDIADNNGAYDFDNNHVSFDTFHYTSETAFAATEEELTTSMTVLKLSEGRNPRLTFTDKTSGTTLYPSFSGQDTNLINLIKSAYQGRPFTFERKHTYRVTISFDTNMTASVMVDGWKVNESGNELYPD